MAIRIFGRREGGGKGGVEGNRGPIYIQLARYQQSTHPLLVSRCMYVLLYATAATLYAPPSHTTCPLPAEHTPLARVAQHHIPRQRFVQIQPHLCDTRPHILGATCTHTTRIRNHANTESVAGSAGIPRYQQQALKVLPAPLASSVWPLSSSPIRYQMARDGVSKLLRCLFHSSSSRFCTARSRAPAHRHALPCMSKTAGYAYRQNIYIYIIIYNVCNIYIYI